MVINQSETPEVILAKDLLQVLPGVDAASAGTGLEIVRDANGAITFFIPEAATTTSSFVLEGASLETVVTSLPLSIGGGAELAIGSIGIPVAESMDTARVAVSWLAAGDISDWTLTLLKRSAGSDFTEVATFTVSTS